MSVVLNASAVCSETPDPTFCPANLPAPPAQAICSLIYAGERIATDLAEIAAVAKQLVSKYRWVLMLCCACCADESIGAGEGRRRLCFRRNALSRHQPLVPLIHPSYLALPSCRSGVYKESGFPHEVVSDLTCRKWQVQGGSPCTVLACCTIHWVARRGVVVCRPGLLQVADAGQSAKAE